MVKLTIDGKEVKAAEGKRILEAALENGIYIPNLCAIADVELPFGACRLCFVEIEGKRGMVTACTEPIKEGMVVHTATEEITKLRRTILDFILARHPRECLIPRWRRPVLLEPPGILWQRVWHRFRPIPTRRCRRCPPDSHN